MRNVAAGRQGRHCSRTADTRAGIGKIDDRHGIATGRREQRLKLIVPQKLLVIADKHEWRGLRKREATGQADGGPQLAR